MDEKRLPKSNVQLTKRIKQKHLDLPRNCNDLVELINRSKIKKII